MAVSSAGNAEQDKSLTVNQAQKAALTLANEALRSLRTAPGSCPARRAAQRVVGRPPCAKLLGRVRIDLVAGFGLELVRPVCANSVHCVETLIA